MQPIGGRCEYSIISPVYNEAENIERHLRGIEAHARGDYEIILVYDFDEDNTPPVVRALDPPVGRLRLIKNELGQGVVNAIRTGFAASRAWLGCVVTMADLSDPPVHIASLVEKMREGYDVVAASRYMPGGRQHGGQLLKRTLARTAGVAAYWITGIGIHDVTTNYRAYSRRIMDTVPIESRGAFELGLELTAKCHLQGWPVGEIPSDWFDRCAAESKFHFWKLLPGYLRWYFLLVLGDPLGLRSRGKWHAPRPSNYTYFGVYDTPGYGWTVQRFKPGIVVVAETSDERTVWIRCRRPFHLDGDAGWELPGGSPNDDEPILDAARRELAEETGYASDDEGTVLAEGLQAAPGMGSFPHYVVLFRNCTRKGHAPEAQVEGIEEARAIDTGTVADWIADGQIQSIPSIAGFQLYAVQTKPVEAISQEGSQPATKAM